MVVFHNGSKLTGFIRNVNEISTYEYLRGTILYVYTTLEETAVNVFGKPLPGRKYSIERNQDDLPDVVVARVVERGPEPSGPFVYIQSCSHDITTLLCRCENTQFLDIEEDILYELLPIEELYFVGINDTTWSRGNPKQQVSTVEGGKELAVESPAVTTGVLI